MSAPASQVCRWSRVSEFWPLGCGDGAVSLCRPLQQRTLAARVVQTLPDVLLLLLHSIATGYGAVVGEGGCHLCPAGTYGKGGSLEDCVPCPFGYTSAPGTTSWKGCVPAAQECPVGQLAPLGAVSKEECGCLPGHGGKSAEHLQHLRPGCCVPEA